MFNNQTQQNASLILSEEAQPSKSGFATSSQPQMLLPDTTEKLFARSCAVLDAPASSASVKTDASVIGCGDALDANSASNFAYSAPAAPNLFSSGARTPQATATSGDRTGMSYSFDWQHHHIHPQNPVEREREVNVEMEIEEEDQQEVIRGDMQLYADDADPFDISWINHRPNSKPKKTLGRYLIGRTIGRGSYGKVKSCWLTQSSNQEKETSGEKAASADANAGEEVETPLAMKIMPFLTVKRIPNSQETIRNEVAVMRRISSVGGHANLVRLIDYFWVDTVTQSSSSSPSSPTAGAAAFGGPTHCLVMPLCAGGCVMDLQKTGYQGVEEERRWWEQLRKSVLSACATECDRELMQQSFPDWLTTISCDESGESDAEENDDATKQQDCNGEHVRHDNYDADNCKEPGEVDEEDEDDAIGRRLPEWQARNYIIQVVNGLQFLHRTARIAHRDIKPANFLIAFGPPASSPSQSAPPSSSVSPANQDAPDAHQNQTEIDNDEEARLKRINLELLTGGRLDAVDWFNDVIKICDFGVSEVMSGRDGQRVSTSGQSTPAIQPPEIASGAQKRVDGSKVDVWGLGVSLSMMLSGALPFPCSNALRIFHQICHEQPIIPRHLIRSRTARHLIGRMLDKNAATRISLDQVMQHEWIAQSGEFTTTSSNNNNNNSGSNSSAMRLNVRQSLERLTLQRVTAWKECSAASTANMTMMMAAAASSDWTTNDDDAIHPMMGGQSAENFDNSLDMYLQREIDQSESDKKKQKLKQQQQQQSQQIAQQQRSNRHYLGKSKCGEAAAPHTNKLKRFLSTFHSKKCHRSQTYTQPHIQTRELRHSQCDTAPSHNNSLTSPPAITSDKNNEVHTQTQNQTQKQQRNHSAPKRNCVIS